MDGTGLYVGGAFTSFGAGSDALAVKRLVRIDKTSYVLDQSFLPAGVGFDNGAVNALAWLSGYNVIAVGGSMDAFRGTPDFAYFAALATPENASFPAGTHYGVLRWILDGPVNALVSNNGVETALGGAFTSINLCAPSCTPYDNRYFARVDVNGGFFPIISDSASPGAVSALASVLSKNYIGAMSGGLDIRGGDGSSVVPAAGVMPSLGGSPDAVAFANLNRYLFVGGVTAAGPVSVSGLARLEAVASNSTYPAYVTSDKFNARLGYGGQVQALVSDNGILYVGGILSDSDGNAMGSVLAIDAETGTLLE